ncbi:MAG: hypothetical protein ACFFAO_13945 [Candidatus Hermodarchaeota archaeon]
MYRINLYFIYENDSQLEEIHKIFKKNHEAYGLIKYDWYIKEKKCNSAKFEFNGSEKLMDGVKNSANQIFDKTGLNCTITVHKLDDVIKIN